MKDDLISGYQITTGGRGGLRVVDLHQGQAKIQHPGLVVLIFCVVEDLEGGFGGLRDVIFLEVETENLVVVIFLGGVSCDWLELLLSLL